MPTIKEALTKELSLLAEAGWTAGDVALHYNCAPSTVRRYARELGIVLTKERSHGALQLRQVLQAALPEYRLEEEYHIGERLRLDFYFPELKLALEYDGSQHKEFSTHFHGSQDNFLEARMRDKRKEELCANQGICLVRLDPKTSISIEELQAIALQQITQIEPDGDNGNGRLRRAIQPRQKVKQRSILSSPAYKEAQRARWRANYQRQKEWRKQHARSKPSPAADQG